MVSRPSDTVIQRSLDLAIHVAGLLFDLPVVNLFANSLNNKVKASYSHLPDPLDQGVINLLFELWGVPMVDLLATRLNNKVETFYSCLPDPIALQGTPLGADLNVCCTWTPPPPSYPLLFKW